MYSSSGLQTDFQQEQSVLTCTWSSQNNGNTDLDTHDIQDPFTKWIQSTTFFPPKSIDTKEQSIHAKHTRILKFMQTYRQLHNHTPLISHSL